MALHLIVETRSHQCRRSPSATRSRCSRAGARTCRRRVPPRLTAGSQPSRHVGDPRQRVAAPSLRRAARLVGLRRPCRACSAGARLDPTAAATPQVSETRCHRAPGDGTNRLPSCDVTWESRSEFGLDGHRGIVATATVLKLGRWANGTAKGRVSCTWSS